ncbi:MAG: hypothetical protein ABIO16_03020 [Nocardioides sp.]
MPRVRESVLARARVAVGATLLLLTVGLLVGAVTAGPSGAAPPGSTPPTFLQLSAPTTANTDGLLGAPTDAIPDVLAQKGVTPITMTLTVSDGSELTKGTVINLTAVNGGTFDPSSITVGSRTTSVPISVTYSRAAANVQLRAALKKSTSTSPGPATSAAFDVVDSLRFAPSNDTTLATGFGADTCVAAFAGPLCGFVLLPHGITSNMAALSSGVCSEANGCAGLAEVQFIAGLDQTIYHADPATLVLRCDKGTCTGKGVSSYSAKISLLKSGDLTVSPACPSKGTLPALSDSIPGGGHYCTDYVSSHRDNAGDLLLEVLFDKDMRGTM